MDTETKFLTPPQSKESEMMVLGCMLTNASSLKTGAEALDDSDFYYTEHKIIFSVLKSTHNLYKPADVHLVCEELKRQDKLKSVGGPGYITTLAQYAGTSAYVEEYVNAVKNKSSLRKLLTKSQDIQKKVLEDEVDPHSILEEWKSDIESIESRFGKKLPILSTKNRLEKQDDFLKKHRGKELLGLRTSKISEFNEKLLGLRELMLLAAAPNVGKTALTIQLGIDVLESEPTACLVYISLEMSAEAIFRRMTLHLAQMDFTTFVRGSANFKEKNEEAFFTKEELEKIKTATKNLESFGERLQIIDSEMCPFIDAKMIINYVEAVKFKTESSKAIVVIDYLQVLPVNQSIRFASENEIDKWRIGEIKKIRDGIKNDPVIVISEARKPSGNSEDIWGGDLSDVMGSARGTYTPDVVMLLSELPPKEIATLFGEKEKEREKGIEYKKQLAESGISLCKLTIPKARDGMQRFTTILEFHFKQNIFKKANPHKLRKEHIKGEK